MSTGCILQFMYTFSIEVRQLHCENIYIYIYIYMCMIYYAFLSERSQRIVCVAFYLRAFSSSAKGIKCYEMPCFLSVTLEQPPNTNLFGIFSIS